MFPPIILFAILVQSLYVGKRETARKRETQSRQRSFCHSNHRCIRIPESQTAMPPNGKTNHPARQLQLTLSIQYCCYGNTECKELVIGVALVVTRSYVPVCIPLGLCSDCFFVCRANQCVPVLLNRNGVNLLNRQSGDFSNQSNI